MKMYKWDHGNRKIKNRLRQNTESKVHIIPLINHLKNAKNPHRQHDTAHDDYLRASSTAFHIPSPLISRATIVPSGAKSIIIGIPSNP